jgi:hypothetical protein
MKRIPFLLLVAALVACNSERAAIETQADASVPVDGSTTALDGSSAADAGQGGGTDDTDDDSNTGVEEDAADAAAPETDVVEAAPRPVLSVPGAAVGRRKQAIARVRLVPGTGTYSVNGRTLEDYFPNKLHQQLKEDKTLQI